MGKKRNHLKDRLMRNPLSTETEKAREKMAYEAVSLKRLEDMESK